MLFILFHSFIYLIHSLHLLLPLISATATMNRTVFIAILLLLSLQQLHASPHLCPTTSCKACHPVCPSFSSLTQQRNICKQSLPLLKKQNLDQAYLSCTLPSCLPTLYSKACGLLNLHNKAAPLAQIRLETSRIASQIQSVRAEKDALNRQTQLNQTLTHYYQQSLVKIEQCKRTFRHALAVRAYHTRLETQIESLPFRQQRIQVARLRSQNSDFKHHFHFWQLRIDSLKMLVYTSPASVRAARDSLYLQMRAYERDANYMRKLADQTLSKEQKAKVIINLKNHVRRQLQSVRTLNAHLIRENVFIRQARNDIYKLLINVWNTIKSRPITCGSNVLTDALSQTISSR